MSGVRRERGRGVRKVREERVTMMAVVGGGGREEGGDIGECINKE